MSKDNSTLEFENSICATPLAARTEDGSGRQCVEGSDFRAVPAAIFPPKTYDDVTWLTNKGATR